MPKTTKTTQKQKPPKPMTDQVVQAAGRRPKGRDEIAAKLGVSPNSVARALGKATNEGRLIKTAKGYQRT
jgi:predicted Rossmann fold nucleotide-binding protein DprA/Smf involved in DNA uptake